MRKVTWFSGDAGPDGYPKNGVWLYFMIDDDSRLYTWRGHLDHIITVELDVAHKIVLTPYDITNEHDPWIKIIIADPETVVYDPLWRRERK